MKHTIPAVVFAGGKSSRMGTDKAQLPFDTYNTMAEYQYRRLSELFEHVYLSSKSDKFDFQPKVIKDQYETFSPLVGIVSLFETLKDNLLFVLSVDAPFVDETVIGILLDRWKGEDAVVARSAGKVQPLCALYSRTILPLAKLEMEKGNHKLVALLEKADTAYVDFGESEIFLNLNHPHEYEKAQKLISS